MEKTEIIKTIKDELTVIAECSVFHGQIESTTVITDSAIGRIADRLIKNHSDLYNVSEPHECEYCEGECKRKNVPIYEEDED